MKKLTISETKSIRGGFAFALFAGLFLAPSVIVGTAIGVSNAGGS